MLGAASSLWVCQKKLFVIVTAGVLCTLILFVTYQRNDFNFLTCPRLTSPDKDRGLCLCPDALENRSLSLNNTSEREHPPPVHKTGQAATGAKVTSGPPESDTIILMWFWPFGVPFELSPCTVYNISGCRLTDDRSLYIQAHGVLIHHRDINGDQSNLPQEPRPWFQKWVWWNMESPVFSNRYDKINKLFNVTCGYRQDATVPVPYGYLVRTDEEKSFELASKDKLVCWIVSHWSNGLKRIHVYDELKQFINIDVYGGHFNKRLNGEEYKKTMQSCKFYLSFENSLCQDYMSGKLWDAMEFGAVPVVLGSSRENYEEMVPGNSFIHVDDYPTMKDLADRLSYLDKNLTEYLTYFEWTKRFKITQTSFGHEHACRSCDYISKNKAYKVINNLNKWYWG